MLSGAAPAERATQAMDSLHTHLVKERERLVLLLAPPFDNSMPSPGYIQGYVPGVRENGGQYTHAAIWAAMAFAALGDGDARLGAVRAARSARGTARARRRSRPTRSSRTWWPATSTRRAPHVGRGGWTWYTGSAGWMLPAARRSRCSG